MLKKIKSKLTDAALGALLVGLVAELLGVDMAPTEIDAIMTALATLAGVYGRWQDRKEAE